MHAIFRNGENRTKVSGLGVCNVEGLPALAYSGPVLSRYNQLAYGGEA